MAYWTKQREQLIRQNKKERNRRQYLAYLGSEFQLFLRCSRLVHFASLKLQICSFVLVPAVSSNAAPSRRAASAAAAAATAPKTATWPSSSSWRCGAISKDPPGCRHSFWHCRDPGDHPLDMSPFFNRGAHTCCRADFVDQVIG